MTIENNEVRIALALVSKEINRGFLWIAGGVVVSLGAYLSADPGGSYLVFWGAPLYGVLKVWRASKVKREIMKAIQS
jgi:DMSO reductase anchor subunit